MSERYPMLIKLDTATRMLAEISSVDEARKLIDLAEAARVYARQVDLGLEAQNHAAEIKLRAQRRAGEILEEMEKSEGGRPETSPRQGEVNAPLTYTELGIDSRDASDWQRIANMADEAFEKYITETKNAEKELTTAALLRLAAQRGDHPYVPKMTGQHPNLEIRRGDFREVLADLDENSAHCILTDPPYGKAYLPLWGDLGIFAARVLRDDGLLITYSGQANHPEVVRALVEHLDWCWMCAVFHAGNVGIVRAGGWEIKNVWKPVLIFSKKDGRRGYAKFSDRIEGAGSDKTLHNWGQPVEEAVELLRIFCKPGDLIVDPFAGGGTVGKAAELLDMDFIGAEISDID